MFDRRVEPDGRCLEEQQPESYISHENPSTHTFAQGETLFKAGSKRTSAYRVVKGGFCHYVKWPDGHHHVIEFVYKGDIIGFGHYQTYLTTATAMHESEVIEINETEFTQALDKDPALNVRNYAAADREFEIIRQKSIGSRPRTPMQRLASYISAMANLSCKSGEGSIEFPQKESLKFLANFLEIGSTEIAKAFLELKKRGLITKKSNCIIVKDQRALDNFVNAAL